MALTALVQKDMDEFLKQHVKVLGNREEQNEVFIAIANFPGRFHFQCMLDAWIHEKGGTHRVITDRYELNKMRGQRYDYLWLDFRIGPRLNHADIDYILAIIGPATKHLVATYNTFVLRNHETDAYEMYTAMSVEDFITVIRNDCWAMKLHGVTDPRFINHRQPLQMRYLLKRMIGRLFKKGHVDDQSNH